ncbi:MAG: hypothetical protein CMF09_07450 [Idiomarina sp.]|nr:hypothetical protein [Idiomarina sp.]
MVGFYVILCGCCLNKNHNDITEEHKNYISFIDGFKKKKKDFNNAEINSLLGTAHPSLTRIEKNLYFRITPAGTGSWVYQYKIHNKPKRMTLGTYGKRPDGMPLVDARDALAEARALVNKGTDPLAEKKRASKNDYNTVDDLAKDWLEEVTGRLEHPKIPIRVYSQEIKPIIGGISLNDVTGLDIRSVLKSVKDRKKTPRPTVVNDTLTYMKQLFDHGVTGVFQPSCPKNLF